MNGFVKKISNYRKTMIVKLPNLKYLVNCTNQDILNINIKNNICFRMIDLYSLMKEDMLRLLLGEEYKKKD
jgi:hypothetical protein